MFKIKIKVKALLIPMQMERDKFIVKIPSILVKLK
jgi:hypothetical protein